MWIDRLWAVKISLTGVAKICFCVAARREERVEDGSVKCYNTVGGTGLRKKQYIFLLPNDRKVVLLQNFY